MDYFGIIKKSYYIALKQKFLWLFVIITSLSYGFVQISSSASEFNYGSFSTSEYLLIGMVSFIFSLVFLILNLTGQGALIIAYNRIEKNEKTDFKHSFEEGLHRFWRILGLMIIVWVLVIISLIILILPIVLLVVLMQYIAALVIGLILFFACLFFWLVLGFIYPYALRIVVLEKISVFSSLRSALHLTRDNFLEVFVMYLLTYAIGMGYGFVLILSFLLAALLLFIIGYGIYLASPLAAMIYGVFTAIILFGAFMVVNSAYTTFNSGLLTILYNRIKNK